MRNLSLATASVALALCASAPAHAATFHYATVITSGTFYDGSTSPATTLPDTSASFSFDFTPTGSGFVITKGDFTDANLAGGQPVSSMNLAGTATGLSMTVDLKNSAGDFLQLVFSNPLMGTFTYGQRMNNDLSISGDFSGGVSALSSVPLPSAAPMFGAAVLALGLVAGVKRRKAAAA